MSKYALITGASRGLGEYLARRFWLDGYNLLLVARSEEALRELIINLPVRNEQRALYFGADLSDVSEVDKLILDVSAAMPHLDVLINNAGTQGPMGPLLQNDMGHWRETLQVNLLSSVAIIQGLIPVLKKSSRASIINLSGGGATSPRANFSAYASSKAGLVRFSETLAEELKDLGITVNCVAPGAMKTGMLEQVVAAGESLVGEKEFRGAKNIIDGEANASFERTGDLALFLCSQVARGITGKLISAKWDNWEVWPDYVKLLSSNDAYTLRRIVGADRNFPMGDK